MAWQPPSLDAMVSVGNLFNIGLWSVARTQTTRWRGANDSTRRLSVTVHGMVMKLLSPRARARLSGVFQALEGLPAVFGQTIVLGMLVVNGDPAATARNILANEGLYRLGFAIPLVAVGFHVAWALLLN